MNTDHGPQFVNYVMVNREKPFSQKAQRMLASQFASLQVEETRIEVFRQLLSSKTENEFIKETYTFTVPTKKNEKHVILPEDKLKNLKNLKNTKPKKHQERFFQCKKTAH